MLTLTAIMLSLSMQAVPVPQMRRRVTEPPRATGTCAALPLDLAATVPIVEVRIGERPYRFLIDTGAQGHGRIKRALAEQLGLAVVGQARTPAPGGTVEERPVYALPALALGGIAFQDLELTAAPVIPGRELPFDGILGLDAFRNFTLTLDYGNRRLHVSDRPLAAGVALVPDQPLATFPVEIDGRSFPAHLDTGNQAASLFLNE
ncbi:MAG TPA: retropepsin-like aspartic protease, partial [Allosphingosinicella sp.]|nr:retropepsin-like aspartic protease [Allosphingosinicella sp.]